ncbi:hypothetical protein PCL1606_37480 [Pseudomonas chlororaphis]|uniref:Uncharacterized protein n=1 Tax=Pseudomonas chlororaphis TaxID=587753 RepID=A0A0D5Y2E1_9PSED|nr:hypothetical protein PCL1606_37480 [Pseudomonas chlororaphis]
MLSRKSKPSGRTFKTRADAAVSWPWVVFLLAGVLALAALAVFLTVWLVAGFGAGRLDADAMFTHSLLL